MNNKIDAYFLLIVLGVAIGAITLIYYNPFQMTIGGPDNWPELLTVTQMEFTTLSDSDIIILHARNSGTNPLTVYAVKINDDLIKGDSIHSLTIEPGDSGIIAIEHDWITGNKYAVNLFHADGRKVGSYTDTA